jgi:hypothetical protein
VCDHVHETLPADPARLHWSIPDPVPVDTDEAVETAYADLADRITRLAPNHRGAPPVNPGPPFQPRRLFAEYLGTLLRVVAVVGSGIMAAKLSPDDVGLRP